MIRSRACRNSPPPVGKDELAGKAHTEGSGTLTLTPATSRAFTPASAPALAPALGLYKDADL